MMSTRTRIRETARTLFLNDGVDGLSMRRVATEVGVTAAALYRHFANKDALVTSVVEEGFEILEKRMRRSLRGRTGREALLGLLDCYVDFAVAYPQYFDFMFQSPRKDVRLYPADLERRKSDSFNIVLDLVAQAMDHGQLREDDVLETALTIWAHAHGLASLYRGGRFGDHPIRFRRIARRSMERIFAGLGS